MYMGQLVEIAPSDTLFTQPAHPYTKALCRAIPIADPHARDFTEGVLDGEVGNNVTPPRGCRFHPRCPMATAACGEEDFSVRLHIVGEEQMSACPYHMRRMMPQEGGSDNADA
jgi:oligopeptide/dipeptide ABC transporter ATP-binding protein